MRSQTEENYLKAIFTLADENGEVNVKDISTHLDLKMPTVTNMMKNLAAKGLLHYESYKPVKLTEEGEKEAALVIRKHRLTEMYLVEEMGFGWEEVHDIAEQIEHIRSPRFFQRMDEILGFPKMDPHGSPIPDKDGKMVLKEYIKLSDCKEGDIVKLVAVIRSTTDFLKFLNSRELGLDVIMKIKQVEPFDNSMTVSYMHHPSETFSNEVCERLLVTIE